MKFGKLIVICLVVTLSLSLFAGIDGDVRKSFKVKEGGVLIIDADLGTIEVQTGSGNSIEIDLQFERRSGSSKRIKSILKDFNLDFDHSGKDLTMTLEYNKDRHNFWDSVGRYLKVNIYVTVPVRYNLEMQTSGGSIEVDDLEGRLKARTSGGSLRFGKIVGPVDGKTSGGSITLESCKGNVNVITSGGSIRIGEVVGDVRAHTSGGGIHVEEVMGVIDAHTSGGSVTARLSKQPTDDCSLKTSGGSINVYLNSDIKVFVDARTSGGRVSTDFPVTIRGELSKRSLRAKINGGGPELYLRTSGGSINIKER